MWINWERPLCTFASLCLQESSPRLAMLCPSVRPSSSSVRLPAWLCVVLPVRHTLQLFALRSPPPPPHTVWCVVFRWSSGADLRSASYLPQKSQIKKKKKRKKNTYTQQTDLRSVSRGDITASLSCKCTNVLHVDPRNTVIHSPSHIKRWVPPVFYLCEHGAYITLSTIRFFIMTWLTFIIVEKNTPTVEKRWVWCVDRSESCGIFYFVYFVLLFFFLKNIFCFTSQQTGAIPQRRTHPHP